MFSIGQEENLLYNKEVISSLIDNKNPGYMPGSLKIVTANIIAGLDYQRS